MEQEKKTYVSPCIEVIELENEEVIATSGQVGSMDIETWSAPTNSQTYTHGASGNDLEDMINDILTIE